METNKWRTTAFHNFAIDIKFMEEFSFYFPAILSTLLIVIPAFISFRDDKRKKKQENINNQPLRFEREYILLLVGLFGALLSFYDSCDSHKESKTNKSEAIANRIKAEYNDSLYKDLLKTNLDTAKQIVKLQNATIDTVKNVLDSSRKILSLQNKFITLQNNSTNFLSNRILTLDSLQKSSFLVLTGGLDTPRLSFVPLLYSDGTYYLDIYLRNNSNYKISVQTFCFDESISREKKLTNEDVNNPGIIGMQTKKSVLDFVLITSQAKLITHKQLIKDKMNLLYFEIFVNWNNKQITALINLNVFNDKKTFELINYLDKDMNEIKGFH